MAGEILFAMDGSLWIQPDGPNSDLSFLGCHRLGDIARPRGDNTQVFCPDPSGPGRYKQVAKIKGPPGLITTSVETNTRTVADFLEGLRCPATLIVTQTKSGKKDRISNWRRAVVLPGFDVTNETYANLVGKDTNDQSMLTVDANIDDVIVVYPLRVYRQAVAETQRLNSIFSCDEEICQTPTTIANKVCNTLYAVANAAVGLTANVLVRVGTGSWGPMATDPFAANEHISAGGCFALNNTTQRVLVFRGQTGTSFAINAMRAAYTDDDGATWTTVTIGSVNGQYVPKGTSVKILDSNHIWVGTDDGYIYFSGDGGATWTTQETGLIQTDAWNWIDFVDENIGFAGGAADVVAITTDGGLTWNEVSVTGGGGDILTGKVFNANQLWVGDDDGDIFYTSDGGVTWTVRSHPSSGAGSVQDMAWDNQYVGVIAWKSGANVTTYYFTKDGGRNWEEVDTTVNLGIFKVMACSGQNFYGVGAAQGGTAVVHQLKPISV